MCARYELNEPPANLAERFGLADLPPQINMSVVRPTDMALIVKRNGAAVLCGWGFSVDWDRKPLINGRVETLKEKPTFRPHLEHRCLVPATGYFEWRSDHGRKHKNLIRPSDQRTFSMAGLIADNRFVILTCPPTPEIAHIHNRMPVVLSPASERLWLDPDLAFESVAHHLVPYDQAPMQATEEQAPSPRQGDLFH